MAMAMLLTLKLLHVSQNEHVLLVSVILQEQREKIIGVGGRVNLPHAYCIFKISKHRMRLCDSCYRRVFYCLLETVLYLSLF